MSQIHDLLNDDLDPSETREWMEAISAVIGRDGAERAHYLLERMVDETRRAGGHLPFPPDHRLRQHHSAHRKRSRRAMPRMEWRIRSMIRWNAMAMVVRANRKPGELGGHIASFASSATLYDVGFNHFWRAPSDQHPGDLLYIQGHSARRASTRAPSSKAASARSSSTTSAWKSTARACRYPHPWLMPDSGRRRRCRWASVRSAPSTRRAS
jgi:pyruvate dehydrogenase E1 component